MFVRKKHLDNIYDLIIKLNNNERKHAKACEKKADDIEKENIKLNETIGKYEEIMFKQENEIELLKSLLTEKNKEAEKIHEYLEKVAEILKNSQEKIIAKKKPTKKDLMIESMSKISDEAKARLK